MKTWALILFFICQAIGSEKYLISRIKSVEGYLVTDKIFIKEIINIEKNLKEEDKIGFIITPSFYISKLEKGNVSSNYGFFCYEDTGKCYLLLNGYRVQIKEDSHIFKYFERNKRGELEFLKSYDTRLKFFELKNNTTKFQNSDYLNEGIFFYCLFRQYQYIGNFGFAFWINEKSKMSFLNKYFSELKPDDFYKKYSKRVEKNEFFKE